MTKNFKLVLALVLSLMMATMIPAMAEGNTITIDLNSKDEGTHTFTAYQLFTGDLAQNATQSDDGTTTDKYPVATYFANKILSNVNWGSALNTTNAQEAFITALKTDSTLVAITEIGNLTTSSTARNDVEAIAKITTPAQATALADVVGGLTLTDSGTSSAAVKYSESTKTASISGLADGYYFVKDAITGTNEENTAVSKYILQVLSDVTIASKSDVPSIDKDIVDATLGNVEAADYNIGDTITYEITGTLPSNYAEYETYYYSFHDTISKGQSVDVSKIKVYKNSVSEANDITANFTKPTENLSGSAEASFEVKIANLKTISGLTSSDKIIVRYEAVLTADAITGATGNKNEAYLEYSNNPNKDHDGEKGQTPKDYTLVFTYELDTTKIAAEDASKTLSGAEFKLKRNSDNKFATVDTNGKITGWVDSQDAGSTLTSGNDGKFIVIGLDAVAYTLIETKAPTGYNLPVDPTFPAVITAEITGDATATHDTDTPALTELKLNNVAGDTTTGKVEQNITNAKGAELPSTGGIGTTIFYVAGSLMVLAAAILLITKRRMGAND